jgi:hypothetical protein
MSISSPSIESNTVLPDKDAAMQLPPQLQQQIAQAVRTSMRIEGYCPTTAQPQTQAQAKAIMEQQRVQVSVPAK